METKGEKNAFDVFPITSSTCQGFLIFFRASRIHFKRPKNKIKRENFKKLLNFLIICKKIPRLQPSTKSYPNFIFHKQKNLCRPIPSRF